MPPSPLAADHDQDAVLHGVRTGAVLTMAAAVVTSGWWVWGLVEGVVWIVVSRPVQAVFGLAYLRWPASRLFSAAGVVFSGVALQVLWYFAPSVTAWTSSPDESTDVRTSIHTDVDGIRWWWVDLRSENRAQSYFTDCPGRFNAYWGWDSESRFWFYCSDDGRVTYWDSRSVSWDPLSWNGEAEPAPPPHALPDYARSPTRTNED